MPRSNLRPAIPQSAFAKELLAELARRGSNGRKLAAAIDSAPQTVNGWLREGRLPGTDLCYRIAEYFHDDPDKWLYLAGHKPEGFEYVPPEIPGWLSSALEGLEDWELRVVAATALSLREARSDPSLAEARRPQDAQESN